MDEGGYPLWFGEANHHGIGSNHFRDEAVQFKVYYRIESVDEDTLVISLVDHPYEFFYN